MADLNTKQDSTEDVTTSPDAVTDADQAPASNSASDTEDAVPPSDVASGDDDKAPASSDTDDTAVSDDTDAATDTAVSDTAVPDDTAVSDDTALSDTAAPDNTDAATDAAAEQPPTERPSTESEPESDPAEVVSDSPEPAGRAKSRPSKLVVGLSLLVVGLLAGAVLLFVHNQGVSQAATQRQAALDAAKSVAADLTTLGAANAARQLESLNGRATGSFREQMAGYATALQAVLKAGNVRSTGTVTAAGIEKLGADTTSVLVTVSSTISSSQDPQSVRRPYRLAIELERDGDRWLASKVDFVP